MKTSYTYFRKNDGLICTASVLKLSDSDYVIRMQYSDGDVYYLSGSEGPVIFSTEAEAAEYLDNMIGEMLSADAITFEIPLYTVEEVQEAQEVLQSVADMVAGNEILMNAIGKAAFQYNLSQASNCLSTLKSQCPRSKAALRGEQNV